MTEYNDYHEEVDIREAEKRYAKRCFQPTYDMTFKLMFGEQGHTRALIHLLNCLHVSKDPITKVVIQNSELPTDGVELKCFRLDITAETDKNDVAQIEMQCDRLLDDKVVITKSLEYWARLFSRGLEREDSLTVRPREQLVSRSPILFFLMMKTIFGRVLT